MSLTPRELYELQVAIEEHLSRIEKIFKPHIRLTLIARDPTNDDADVLLTKDDLGHVIKVIERQVTRPPTFGPPARGEEG